VLVDHVIPAGVVIVQAQQSGRYPLDKWAGFYLMSNLQGLCVSCHFAKTAEDKAHVGAWPDAIAIEAAAPKKVFSF
jgi:5-methylcytosine-specific restriction endonuclease McrA